MKAVATLRARLATWRRLIRLALAGAGFGRLLCLLSALVAADYALDRTLRLPGGQRLAVLLAMGAALLWQLARWLVLPLLRPLPDEALALELEGRTPGSGDLLASALFFALGRTGGPAALRLCAEAQRRAERVAQKLHPRALTEWGPARRWLAAGGAAALLLGLAGAFSPRTAGLWFRRNVLLAAEPWPRQTQLTLAEAPDRVPRGADAVIEVAASGKVPPRATLTARGRETGRERILRMQLREGARFVARLSRVTEDTRYTVRAGDGLLRGGVRVVSRPRVEEASVKVLPPDYIGREPVELSWNAPVFRVPSGSELLLEIVVSKELGSAVCRPAEGPAVPFQRTGPRRAALRMPVRDDLSCEISLTDGQGVGSADPLLLEVQALPDDPPRVTLTAPGVGQMLLPTARLPLRAGAEDDYGVTGLHVEATWRDGQEQRRLPGLTLWEGAARTGVEATGALQLRGRDLPPKGRLSVEAVAADNLPEARDGPQTGRSGRSSFRLVSEGELLNALLLAQRDLRRDLEEQIRRQQRLLRRLRESGGAPPGAAREQRTVASVLKLTAAGYGDVLLQMRNNRAITPETFRLRDERIVRPLRRLGSAEGAALRAAALLEEPGQGIEGAMPLLAEAQRTMQRVRERMMLLEGYASLVSSVQEVSQQQRSLMENTRRREEELLEELLSE